MAQGVEFDEDKWSNPAYRRPQQAQPGGMAGGYGGAGAGPQGYGYGYGTGTEAKGIIGWLIRHHLAKNEKGAQIIMLIIVAVNIGITIWALMSLF